MQLRRMMVFLGVAGASVLLSLGVPPLFGQQRPQSGQQFPASYRAPRLADKERCDQLLAQRQAAQMAEEARQIG